MFRRQQILIGQLSCAAARRGKHGLSLDVPLAALLKHFAVEVDLASSLARLSGPNLTQGNNNV